MLLELLDMRQTPAQQYYTTAFCVMDSCLQRGPVGCTISNDDDSDFRGCHTTKQAQSCCAMLGQPISMRTCTAAVPIC